MQTLYGETMPEKCPPNPASPSWQIADRGMMLRILAGSESQGTSIADSGDRDEMGICVPSPSYVTGLRHFEQYEFHTALKGLRSGPGDLDFTAYGLQKWARMAAEGNPTPLTPLFVAENAVLFCNEFGREVRNRRDMFLSMRAAAKFKGYLHSQRLGLMGLRSGGTRNQGRQDYRDKYGFDTKFAAHMVRLGIQGVELLTTGLITLPMKDPELTWIRDLRVGKHTKEEALEWAADLENQIEKLQRAKDAYLPPEPDWQLINDWLFSVHRRFWGLTHPV